MLSLLPLILMQVGPAPVGGPVSAVPDELYEQRRMNQQREAEASPPAPPVRPADPCRTEAQIAPLDAVEEAETRLETAQGADRAAAAECLGIALASLERWDEAEQAFATALEAVPGGEAGRRAELGVAAAISAEARGDFARALTLFQAAQGEAQRAGDAALTGRIARDMAHPMNRLGQTGPAAAALAAARAALPDDPPTWLISARLSRQRGLLAEAQQQIERAAMLAPRDPEVGLEAGVIAVLSGNDAAARRSWQSVVSMAPGSPVALTAQGYLDQLGQPAEAAGR